MLYDNPVYQLRAFQFALCFIVVVLALWFRHREKMRAIEREQDRKDALQVEHVRSAFEHTNRKKHEGERAEWECSIGREASGICCNPGECEVARGRAEDAITAHADSMPILRIPLDEPYVEAIPNTIMVPVASLGLPQPGNYTCGCGNTFTLAAAGDTHQCKCGKSFVVVD